MMSWLDVGWHFDLVIAPFAAVAFFMLVRRLNRFDD